jgi:two-component system nitrate/nitrite response regulator NarL
MTEPSPRIRILLVDDHLLIRQGLRMLLENAGDLEVVGEAARCADVIALAAELHPDIVLLDLDLGGENGLDCITALVSAERAPRVLVLTGVRDAEAHRRAIRLGAAGIVQKEQAGEMLVKAIRRVHGDETWVDHALAAAIFSDYRRDAAAAQHHDADGARIAELTPREREIVALVAQGLNTAAIGKRLDISEKTVRNNLSIVYDKLQVRDRLALALYAARHGLTAAPK